MNLFLWLNVALAAFALGVPSAFAGPIPISSTTSGTIDLTSGADYFGWSGSSVSITSTVTSMTPASVTTLSSGSVQDVYNAIVNVTGFQPNEAGTMTVTRGPGGSVSVSVAMTYSKFGLTTTATETLNNINPQNASPAALLNTMLISPSDQLVITSNWGEDATFGLNGNTTSAGVADVEMVPEPATFALVAIGMALSFLIARRRTAPAGV